MNFDLARLGLGEVWTTREENGLRMGSRTLPEGAGWCRAVGAPEEAWPAGADLCVLVEWFPDVAFRRNYHSGSLPSGAEEHWRDRLAATVAALEWLGYLAEQTGPPRTPHHHSRAELVVYQMTPGVSAVGQPADAWKGAAPSRPNFIDGYLYHQAPMSHIERVLEDAQLTGKQRYGQPPSPEEFGSCIVRSVTETLWPVGAELCALVEWRPAPEFRPSPDTGEIPPPGAADHWDECTARVVGALVKKGYQVRRRERPWSLALDDSADLLVYRGERPDDFRHRWGLPEGAGTHHGR
ncbi:hypothetical protein [Streptomyces sp. NPDC054786]